MLKDVERATINDDALTKFNLALGSNNLMYQMETTRNMTLKHYGSICHAYTVHLSLGRMFTMPCAPKRVATLSFLVHVHIFDNEIKRVLFNLEKNQKSEE